jgi:hypothetical protein
MKKKRPEIGDWIYYKPSVIDLYIVGKLKAKNVDATKFIGAGLEGKTDVLQPYFNLPIEDLDKTEGDIYGSVFSINEVPIDTKGFKFLSLIPNLLKIRRLMIKSIFNSLRDGK